MHDKLSHTIHFPVGVTMTAKRNEESENSGQRKVAAPVFLPCQKVTTLGRYEKSLPENTPPHGLTNCTLLPVQGEEGGGVGGEQVRGDGRVGAEEQGGSACGQLGAGVAMAAVEGGHEGAFLILA